MSFFQKKSVTECNSARVKLKRNLKLRHLLAIGIGSMIGAGIFVLTGNSAAYVGPAVFISFLLSGLLVICIALLYSEIATTLPTAGGPYNFAYVVLGEIYAALTGWSLLIFYSFCAALVASGWSSYITNLAQAWFVNPPMQWFSTPFEGGYINLPAALIPFLLGSCLYRGNRNSKILNNFFVFCKMSAILIFCIMALPKFQPQIYWQDFMPRGWHGIVHGSGIVFLAFAGFDMIAVAAEESINPQRDLPIAMLSAIIIAILAYVAVAMLTTGMIDYQRLDVAGPIAYALRENGLYYTAHIVAIGAIFSTMGVLMLFIFGQSRIVFSMARDGMLPRSLSQLNRFKIPFRAIFLVSLLHGCLAGFFPIITVANVASFALLIVFTLTSLCVVLLRKQHPELERPFRCPHIGLLATITVITCLTLAGHIFMHSYKYIIPCYAGALLAYYCQIKQIRTSKPL